MGREKKPITFWCELGGHEVTEFAGPGQTPHYCAEHRAEARRHLAKMRVRAHRERKRKEQPR